MLTQSVCSDESAVAGMAANLVFTMSCFARSRPEGLVRDFEGVRIVDVGPEHAMFNAALLTSPVQTEDDLAERIAASASHFRHRRSHWCFWICEGLLATHLRRRLDRLFGRYGLHFTSKTPGLMATSLKDPRRPLANLSVRHVSDTASRQSFCHIMAASFEGPAKQLASIYGSTEFWHSDFRGWLGSVNGSDVSAAATVAAAGVTGIYAVATLPGHTRRGLAEALVRRAVAESIKSVGEQPLVLQSTPVAIDLYQRMGFRPVTSFSLYTSS